MSADHACEYRNRVTELELENATLKAELAKYNVPSKNSLNSSIPPSQDQTRSLYPRRQKSNKKPGGQPGHQGKFHPFSPVPDEMVVCPLPDYCVHCGGSEIEMLGTMTNERRQVIDIPDIRPYVVEYRQQRARCYQCGKMNQSKFPEEVKAPVQIGSRAQGLATYFKISHALSDERLVEVFEDVLGFKVSQGWVENTLSRKADLHLATYEQIRRAIQVSPVVGSDETGIRINGKRGFIWVFQTEQLACFKTAFSRGFNVIEETLGQSFSGTWVSDRYRAQLKVQAGFNQLCLAHIIRECRYLEEAETCEWATRLKVVLTNAMDLKREQCTQQNSNYSGGYGDRAQRIEEELAQCFAHGPPAGNKGFRLFKHLRLRQDQLLRFLYNPNVPYDNNGSERALRHWALLRKVFGGFRTLAGVGRYDVLLSVIESAKRQRLNVLEVLSGQTRLALH